MGDFHIWVGLGWYRLNNETWKTLYTSTSVGGSANRQTTGPTRSIISNGLIYLGDNFPFFQNLKTPFFSETLRNTDSPT